MKTSYALLLGIATSQSVLGRRLSNYTLAFANSRINGLHTLNSFQSRRINRLASVSSPMETIRMMFGGGRTKIDYNTLKGSAKEAADAAVAGDVPIKSKDGYDIATFAAGCFWGIELAFQRVDGVMATHVGYTQGKTQMPTYEEVCSGASGHTEAVQVYYDRNVVQYRKLLEVLFGRINPTQVNGQGNDWGTQYRTGVYCHTEEQKKEAEDFFITIQSNYKDTIATELKTASVFYPAEDYHQQYLAKGGRFGLPQSAAKGCNDPIRCYG